MPMNFFPAPVAPAGTLADEWKSGQPSTIALIGSSDDEV
jgi:hypothetical protein